MFDELTPRQQEAIGLIKSMSMGGIPPTRRELAAKMGCHVNNVHGLLERLVSKGKVRRIPGKARAIVVLETL